MQSSGTRWSARRWALPAVVLAVGLTLAWWGSAREAGRMAAARDYVHDLCRDIAAGADMTGRLNADNATVDRRAASALRAVCPDLDAASAIDISITPGERDTAGAAAGAAAAAPRATHTATLKIDDEELLILRLDCSDPDQIAVLGYAQPRPRD